MATSSADTAPGTQCTPSSGTCSLRELIEYENSLKPPATPDTINVPAGYYGLSNGALTITQSVSIVGGGARTTAVQQISSTPDRVFDVQIPTNPTTGKPGPVPTVGISGLKVYGGTAGSNNNYYGGDIRNQGTLTLSEDWITGGSASSGGGISNLGGTLTVTHSLVSSNAANTGGADSGGIQNIGNSTTGAAAILEVDNSTIADNSSALGGGITSGNDSSNAVSIVNSTIAFNDGGTRQDLKNAGGLLVFDGTISVRNSVVAFNTVGFPSAGTASNCGASAPGTISSSGYNLETGTDCGFASTGDLQSTDPKFTSSVPQDNGGNTDTLGVHGASPAIDAVPPTAANCGGTDQRDLGRPQGAGCDVGAYELFQPGERQRFSLQVAVARATVFGPVSINWGDGTSSSANTKIGPIIGTHTYADGGIYTGTVSWTDDGGAHSSSFDVKVTDAALTASPDSLNANAGQAFTGPVATFTDADASPTSSIDYSARINWGDGKTSAGTVSGSGPFVVKGTHTYAAGGFYPVTVSISDAGGATATATGTATVTPQARPSLVPSAPIVKSTTSAGFATTVNPGGLVTGVVFEYGPALAASRDIGHLRALAGAPITYSARTPTQTVGPDYSNHPVTATVTGLLPNTTYHVRAVATNSAGSTTGPDQTLTTPADPPPPPPVLGKSANVKPVAGLVLFKLPGKAHASDPGARIASPLTKGTGFVPLTEARQLPSGTQIDARLGTIQLTAATAQHHTTQTGTFNGGLFGFAQDRRGVSKGLTTLSLLEGAFAGAPSYSSCTSKRAADLASPTAHAALSGTILQALHSRGHGRFRTRGRYASATVRGTEWTTTDRCNGTLIAVQRHTVAVTDFVRHITILVHQGHSYLARASRSQRG